MAYERASIAKMHGYIPGKQPASWDVAKLNTNENPYPPAQGVMQALQEVPAEALRRYPEPLADTFRAAAARLHGLRPEHLMAVNGGDELLRLCFSTFVEPGQHAVTLEPSYSLYPVLAEAHGARLLRVEASPDWSIPADFAQRANQQGANLTLLVNPHAPSGTLFERDQIERLAGDLDGVLLVDEAYVDFVDPELDHDLTPLVRELPNLLLLRTLSKGYSLAGLRFGYAIGAPGLIEPMLYKTRDSFNVDALAQRLACAALEHRESAAQTWSKVRSERTRVNERLVALGLRSPTSQSNFLLARAPQGGPTATELHAALETRGVWVRHFAQPRLENDLRITIGTPEQNDRLLDALADILQG